MIIYMKNINKNSHIMLEKFENTTLITYFNGIKSSADITAKQTIENNDKYDFADVIDHFRKMKYRIINSEKIW